MHLNLKKNLNIFLSILFTNYLIYSGWLKKLFNEAALFATSSFDLGWTLPDTWNIRQRHKPASLTGDSSEKASSKLTEILRVKYILKCPLSKFNPFQSFVQICSECFPHFTYFKLSQNAYLGLRYLFEILALKTRGILLSSVSFDLFRVSVLEWRTTLTTACSSCINSSRPAKQEGIQ